MTAEARQVPSREAFVVAVEPDRLAEARSSLSTLGTVQEVEGTDLLLLRLAKSSPNPRRAWREILRRVPSARWAAPVLLDERGEPHLPTGEISIRFQRPPAQKELDDFALPRALQLRQRNEFVPEQATFRLARPRDTYLPDLLLSLRDEASVALAWANTLSKYHRV